MGQNYAALRDRFWTGATGRALRGHTDAQLLAVYLVTCPHANAIGLYHLSVHYVVSDTGMTTDRVVAAFDKLAEPDINFAQYDTNSEVVYVPNMAAEQLRNLGERDKRRPMVQAQIDAAGGTVFADAWWDRYGRWWGLREPTAKVKGAY